MFLPDPEFGSRFIGGAEGTAIVTTFDDDTSGLAFDIGGLDIVWKFNNVIK
mgnify:FL=1